MGDPGGRAGMEVELQRGITITSTAPWLAGDRVRLLALTLGALAWCTLFAWRGYFIVVAFIVSAVITPPDVVSQLSLAIPMCLLYEVGILAAGLFIRHTQAPETAE